MAFVFVPVSGTKGSIGSPKIPYDKKFVEAIVELKPVVEYDKKFEGYFEEIIEKIL